MRKEFEMTAEQEKKILEACKFVPYLVIGGVPQRSPQERANDAWEALGKELGFAYMTVRATGKGHRFFTAESTDLSKTREWRWVDHKGQSMTEWSATQPPPPELQTVSDAKGIMHVEFRDKP